MQHAKIKTHIPQADGTKKIDTKSYHEDLSSIKEEIEQNILSTRMTLLTDIIKCLSVITENTTNELNIHIKEEHGRLLIVKTWTVKKEYYGR